MKWIQCTLVTIHFHAGSLGYLLYKEANLLGWIAIWVRRGWDAALKLESLTLLTLLTWVCLVFPFVSFLFFLGGGYSFGMTSNGNRKEATPTGEFPIF